MQDIIVGRNKEDLAKWGSRGTILIGKHYISMENTQSLSNNVYLDVAGAHVVFICGKRGGGKCLTGDTLITLSDGREIPIKDLEKYDQDIISLNNNLKVQHAPKTDFYRRTVETVLNVTLRSGKCIRLTPEHPLLTIEGWKPVEELKKGSRIATPRRMPSFGEQAMPEHKVKLLAYLLAEGHLSNGFVLFSNDDEEIVTDFSLSLHMLDPEIELKNHGNNTYRVVNNHTRQIDSNECRNEKGQFKKGTKFKPTSIIRTWLHELELYGKLAPERKIPDCIFTLPKHGVSLFLNRLFSCDGTIYRDENRFRIAYSSASKTLIQQVQSLLTKFGIQSRFREKYNNNFRSFELEIQAQYIHSFLQEIGFFGQKEERQQQALWMSVQHNPNVDTIPKELWQSYRPKSWTKVGKELKYSTPKSARSMINYASSRHTLQAVAIADENEEIMRLATSDVFWDEIVHIEEEHGEIEVYDITVPEHHNFVADGIIVHNSYTMGAIAEGFHLLEEAIKQNLSVILLDTMGIYWTMKYPNHQDKILLDKWGLKPQSIPIKIFTPEKYYHIYRKQGIPSDVPFTLAPSAIDQDDWCNAFKVDKYSEEGVLISNLVLELKKTGEKYTIDQMIETIRKNNDAKEHIKEKVISMLKMAREWGVFSDHGTPLTELAKGGQISVLDVSCYATMPGGWDVKSLIVGLVSQRLFIDRMVARKNEEFNEVTSATRYFSSEKKEKQQMPLVWLVIDEAHEFLPREGKVASTDALVTIMREGRQPGISLILATQQPGKIHTDVMTQSDTVLSHRITAKIDVDALGMLMQSYMRTGLVGELDKLPRVKGAGILFDDSNEKMYPIRIRPRFTWHGGSSPSAIPSKKKTEEDNAFL